MSLHIEITDEAKTELEHMRKKNLFSSIVVAVLTFVLLTLLFIAAKIVIAEKTEVDVVAYVPPQGGGDDPESTEIPTQEASSSTPQVASIITSTGVGEVSVPVVDVPTAAPSAISPTVNIGAMGLGSGMGSGHGGSALPPTVVQRCTLQDRLQRIQASGGSPKYEEAVVKGLKWLMKQQEKDGSWCPGGNAPAMTGLALLSYLAHCETPYSEEFGESCQNAISYLISVGKKNSGYLSEEPKGQNVSYEHAICTYALSEANMFCDQIGLDIPGLKETLEKAGSIIVQSQANEGGWMYFYRTKAEGHAYLDLSVSGWNIQALRALMHSGVKTDAERALRRAEIFVKKWGNPKTGEFQYSAGQWRDSMIPVGVLSLQMMGAGQSREAREGIKRMERVILPEFWEPYVYYYAAQVFLNRGGEPWANFGKKMGDKLVSYQKSDGSWPIHDAALIKEVKAPASLTRVVCPKGGNKSQQCYETCLNILTLEVYYRFLPATGDGIRNVTEMK